MNWDPQKGGEVYIGMRARARNYYYHYAILFFFLRFRPLRNLAVARIDPSRWRLHSHKVSSRTELFSATFDNFKNLVVCGPHTVRQKAIFFGVFGFSAVFGPSGPRKWCGTLTFQYRHARFRIVSSNPRDF